MNKEPQYPIIDAWAQREIQRTRLTAIIIGALLIITLLLATSCQPDYSNKPQAFHVGDLIKLDGINPRKSFVPYDCCTCPCVITGVYTKEDNYHWYYNLKDTRDSTLTNVVTNQLKKIN